MPAHPNAPAVSRRALLAASGALGLAAISPAVDAAAVEPAWAYPIAWPGGLPGDGFFIRHGFGCENSTYYPGLRHTGENWYGVTANAAGADVLAVTGGTVVYAAFDYPGRVVIIEHPGALYSVYGHLDNALQVAPGERVVTGQRIGVVLTRSDDETRSHLHFEIRTFYLSDEVNGDAPRYGFTCGLRCPPGPGYWPIDAPDHPADLGWRNPVHVIARRSVATAANREMTVEVPTTPATDRLAAWSELPWRDGSVRLDDVPISPGERFALAGVKAGSDAARGRNAAGYRLWYRIEQPPGRPAWVSAITPDDIDRNLDGSPAGIGFNLLPSRP